MIVVPTGSSLNPTPTVSELNRPAPVNNSPTVFLPGLPTQQPGAMPTTTPQSLVEFIKTSVPRETIIKQNKLGPLLVFTYTQRLDEQTGTYIVAACVKNIGDETRNLVNLTFDGKVPGMIRSMWAGEESAQMTANQHGMITISELQPGIAKKFEVVVDAAEMPLPTLMAINVVDAYKLTRPEVELNCEPQNGMATAPEFAPSIITIGGEHLTTEDLAALIATQEANPTSRSRDLKPKINPPASEWRIQYQSNLLVLAGVASAVVVTFGLYGLTKRR